jgi:hypothetical protein
VTEQVYDGTQDWSKRVTEYDSADPETRRAVKQTDSVPPEVDGPVETIIREWDYGAAPWSRTVEHRDRANRLLWSEVVGDDHSRVEKGWDYARLTPWKEYQKSFDSLDRPTHEHYTFYSSVEGKFSRSLKEWDYGPLEWSYKETLQDYLGRPTYDAVVLDSNAKTVREWDYSGQVDTWASRETHYGTNGNPLWQRDIYPPQNQISKHVFHEWGDPQGRWLERITTYPDGSKSDKSEEKIVYSGSGSLTLTGDPGSSGIFAGSSAFPDLRPAASAGIQENPSISIAIDDAAAVTLEQMNPRPPEIDDFRVAG